MTPETSNTAAPIHATSFGCITWLWTFPKAEPPTRAAAAMIPAAILTNQSCLRVPVIPPTAELPPPTYRSDLRSSQP